MCGIYCLFENKLINYDLLTKWSIKTLSHRGPDATHHKCFTNDSSGFRGIMIHNRLRIVGLGDNCDQPIGQRFIQSKSDLSETYWWVHNGEIYNYKSLQDKSAKLYSPDGCLLDEQNSDSQCIGTAYKKNKGNVKEWYNSMDGVFSVVFYDPVKNKVIFCRDPIGVKPLYYCYVEQVKTGKIQRFELSSEPKGLSLLNENISCEKKKDLGDNWKLKYGAVEPGHVYTFDLNTQQLLIQKTFQWEMADDMIMGNRFLIENTKLIEEPLTLRLKSRCRNMIRHLLIESVWKRIECCDCEFGVLLSGGLDSSLIVSIIMKLWKLKHPNSKQTIKSFSIGFQKNSPDLEAARKLAKELGTEHHEYIVPIHEGIQETEQSVYHLDMFDVTTVRSSTPMIILCRKIKQMFPEIKVLFSGEGSDEIFAGYAYFKDYENLSQLKNEVFEKIKNLHYSDVLRCDRSSAANGIEIRVPFLDKKFVINVINCIPFEFMAPDQKTEKMILRESFDPDFIRKDVKQENQILLEIQVIHPFVKKQYEQYETYLSHEFLYRAKEQFSDGVGHMWIDTLKKIAELYCCKNVSGWEKTKSGKTEFKIPDKIKMDRLEIDENTEKPICIPEYYMYRYFMKKHPRFRIDEDDDIQYDIEENEFLFDRLKQITMRNWVPWTIGSVMDPSGRFQRK